jgi:hypothetical protein
MLAEDTTERALEAAPENTVLAVPQERAEATDTLEAAEVAGIDVALQGCDREQASVEGGVQGVLELSVSEDTGKIDERALRTCDSDPGNALCVAPTKAQRSVDHLARTTPVALLTGDRDVDPSWFRRDESVEDAGSEMTRNRVGTFAKHGNHHPPRERPRRSGDDVDTGLSACPPTGAHQACDHMVGQAEGHRLSTGDGAVLTGGQCLGCRDRAIVPHGDPPLVGKRGD